MFRKILGLLIGLTTATSSHAAWDFRGEPNGWGTTRMAFVGESRHFIRQAFASNQTQFKVARDDGWVVSFPAQNFKVPAGKTYDIIFFENTKTIQADAVPATENWVYRGTTNGFGITPMTKNGATFTICQDFGATDPRFKISNGNKAAWVENYPESDFRVTPNTSFDIAFTPATRNIAVTKRSSSCATADLNIDRSLIVHDQATLNAADFSLISVMNQLAGQLNALNPSAPVTNATLFARMWDTQNVPPGANAGGPNCTGNLNGFPVECRPEGKQAFNPTVALNNYHPIALVNRFDLRDKTGFKDCGEHRIIFGLNSLSIVNRNFIIFEATLPNPTPGIANGCAPIVNFWKNLSNEPSAANRATALRNFYFNGIPSQGVRAVIDSRNYGIGAGQIRTNQFIEGTSWVLKEFKIAIENGVTLIKPVSDKNNPFGELFNTTRTDALATNFRSQFIIGIGNLLGSDLSSINLPATGDQHNNGQSHANSPIPAENDYLGHSVNFFSASNPAPSDFRNAIQAELTKANSNLSVDQLLRRAMAMTCGGCHQPSGTLTGANSVGPNQSWPDTLGFVHVSESVDSTNAFPISPALRNVFLPARKIDMQNFINQLNAPAAPSNAAPSSVPPATPPLSGKRSG